MTEDTLAAGDGFDDPFPTSDVYDIEAALTGLGTGEALVTVLDPDGAPTLSAATRLVAPKSQMDPVDDATVQRLVDSADLAAKHGQEVDRESAHELLAARAEAAAKSAAVAEAAREGAATEAETTTTTRRRSSRSDTAFEAFTTSAARRVGSEVRRQLLRGVLGTLFKGR